MSKIEWEYPPPNDLPEKGYERHQYFLICDKDYSINENREKLLNILIVALNGKAEYSEFCMLPNSERVCFRVWFDEKIE